MSRLGNKRGFPTPHLKLAYLLLPRSRNSLRRWSTMKGNATHSSTRPYILSVFASSSGSTLRSRYVFEPLRAQDRVSQKRRQNCTLKFDYPLKDSRPRFFGWVAHGASDPPRDPDFPIFPPAALQAPPPLYRLRHTHSTPRAAALRPRRVIPVLALVYWDMRHRHVLRHHHCTKQGTSRPSARKTLR